MNKKALAKTATSRTRKKNNELVLADTDEPFINYLLSKGYSKSTSDTYYRDYKNFKIWCGKQGLEAEEAQYNDITSYLLSLGNVAQITKGCYLRSIKHYFNYLIFLETREENPVAFINVRGAKRKTLYHLLNRQELDTLYHNFKTEGYNSKKPQGVNVREMVAKRNKAMLGLILFQALDTIDLIALSLNDIKLKEGKIYIPGGRRSNERELKLTGFQVMDLMEYTLKTRTDLLSFSGKKSDKFFVSIGSGERLHNSISSLLKKLRQINPAVTSMRQLNASVIVHWLKLNNLRRVQYMAGHRYVSSTEAFLVNDIQEMMADIERFHPVG